MINKYFLDGLGYSLDLGEIFENNDFEGLEKSSIKDNLIFLSFITSFISQKGGIENILMKYEEVVDGNKFSSHNWEQYILGLTTLEKLKGRDYKRYILGSIPFANHTFKNILNLDKEFKFEFEKILDYENPFRIKYNGKKFDALKKEEQEIYKSEILEERFAFLRDYINEVSFAKDAAGIGGMSGATDFLQLYKYVMTEEIIKIDNRKQIILELFKLINVENSKDSALFIEAYDNFINTLKFYNINDDKRLSRLYNRLYYIFSFVLNTQKPEEFPIYFSATRNTLRVFGVEGYENVVKVYKEFLLNGDFKDYINIYLKGVGINENNYCRELKEKLPFVSELEKLFINHAKYRFFQDICWILNRSVLDGQDFINNLGNFVNDLFKGEKFKFNELQKNEYLGDITFGEIINIKYLEDEGYIKEISQGEYQVLKFNFYKGAKFNFNKLKDKKYLGDITFGEIVNIKYLEDEGYIKEISQGEYQLLKIDEKYFRDIKKIEK